jgi:hypothetical protein
MPLEYEGLTKRIIGAAIEVHRRLGPGFLESIYEKALLIELKKRNIPAATQLEIPIVYEGVEVGRHRLICSWTTQLWSSSRQSRIWRMFTLPLYVLI